MASALILKAFSVAVVAGLESGFGVVAGRHVPRCAGEPGQLLPSAAAGARRPGLVLLILALAVRPTGRLRQGRRSARSEERVRHVEAALPGPWRRARRCSRCWRALPLAVHNPYLLGLLTLLAIYGILLIGLDVTVGYLGQVNLAQAAFLGLGAYTAGLLVTRARRGMPLALARGVAALPRLSAALLALPALRLEGPQFALATLSFTALTATVLNELEWLTGGRAGPAACTARRCSASRSTPRRFYWLCMALLALVWIADAQPALLAVGARLRGAARQPHRHRCHGCRHLPPQGGRLRLRLGSGRTGRRAVRLQLPVPAAAELRLRAHGHPAARRRAGRPQEPVGRLRGRLAGGAAAQPAVQPHPVPGASPAAAWWSALAAAARGLSRKTTKPFQALAPVVAMGSLVVGGMVVKNTEDWRKAIFALMLFSVVVGLPEGLMGFAARVLAQLFRVAPAAAAARCAARRGAAARPADGAPLLELRDLKRHFGGVKAVDGISMIVRAGQIHGLIGPNGSGKSTLVNVISGLYAPSAGEVLLRGAALPAGSLFRTAQAGVARTFQNLQLFTELTALENVMVALRGVYRSPLVLVLLGLGRAEDRRARSDALALLELVGLGEQARTPAKDLTYGAQRFLEIARALARKPELLILDEPAAGLAHPDMLKQVEIIRRVHQRGVTIVLIEHHMDVVSELCDVVTVLDGGRCIAEGPPEEVKRHPKVIEAYLGEVEAGPDAPAAPVQSPA